MARRLLTPKWVAAHLVVLAVTAVFVSLGMWQLDRLEQRRQANSTAAARFAMDPVPFDSLEGEDPTRIEFRRVTLTGRALVGSEILIRSQVHQGSAGYHVVVPVSHRGAAEVLVNRGWIPLGTDVSTIDHQVDEDMVIRLEGWIHRSQARPPLGPEDPPDGQLMVMNRVDIDRVRQQTDPRVELASVYIVELAERASELPIPLEPPVLSDEGPHLGYAIQWFSFAVIAVVGYVFLTRRRLGR